MIVTYKKLGTLALALRESEQGSEYLQKADELVSQYKERHNIKSTPDELKQEREQKSEILFQQYQAACQAGNTDKAIEHLKKQT